MPAFTSICTIWSATLFAMVCKMYWLNSSMPLKVCILTVKSTEMGKTVIVAYKPKPGKADELKALMKTHLPRLKAEGLVRDKESYIMEAADGTIVEVFE